MAHTHTTQSHEFDECRFDVAVNNCVWYLRAETPEDKTHWIEVLQSYKVNQLLALNILIDKQIELFFSFFFSKAPAGSFDLASLRRHGSAVSLQSNSIQMFSSNVNTSLREKINEIETFKDLLVGQINNLQQ